MFTLRRSSIQNTWLPRVCSRPPHHHNISHRRTLTADTSNNTSSATTPHSTIVTNTNLHDFPCSIHHQFKHALNSIPTHILRQLLKRNRLKVCGTSSSSSSHHNHHHHHHDLPSKKLLLSKLYRLTSSSRSRSRSRVNVANFSAFCSDLTRKTDDKLRALNEYFNAHRNDINRNHHFYLTLRELIAQLSHLNANLHEIQSTASNPSVVVETVDGENNTDKVGDRVRRELNRDFLYDLLPCMHADTHVHSDTSSSSTSPSHAHAYNYSAGVEDDMLRLWHSFVRFTNFPRITMLDHIQCIAQLCLIDDILDGFLVSRMHPSRSKHYQHRHHSSRRHNEYETDDEEDEDDVYDDDDDEEECTLSKDPHIEMEPLSSSQSRSRPQNSRQKRRPSSSSSSSSSTSMDESMDESTLRRDYEQRLRNIYAMDLAQFGVFGVDENVRTQLKRALLSRGLHPALMRSVHLEHNKGVLFHGPAGTGKTLLAKSLAQLLLVAEANVSIVNGPEIEDVYVGQTEKNIRGLFERAQKEYAQFGMYAPLHLIVFDEMDSIGKKRDSASHSKVYDRSVQQLLSCLDGARSMQNVVCVATTNRYHDIDNALLRPGRFGVHVYIGLPDEEQRRVLLTDADAQHNMLRFLEAGERERDASMQWLVQLTDGLSHSDIVSLLTQSKINAIERLIQQYMEEHGQDGQEGGESGKDVYQHIEENLCIESRDIVCALDEIRINQVYREGNNKPMHGHYAYDIEF